MLTVIFDREISITKSLTGLDCQFDTAITGFATRDERGRTFSCPVPYHVMTFSVPAAAS
jgi:hypothetical protein